MKVLAHLLLLAALVPALSLPGFSTERQKDSLQSLRLQKQQAETRLREQQRRDEMVAREMKVREELKLFRSGKLPPPPLMKSAGTPTLFTVSGTVTTEDNGFIPAFNISVISVSGYTYIYIKDTTFSPTNQTSFRYSLKLPAGQYALGLNQIDNRYVADTYYDDKYDLYSANSIVVADNRDSVNFRLRLGGTIQGTVRDIGGSVLSGVRVEAGTFSGSQLFSDYTDLQGAYSLPRLLAGKYFVRTNSDTLLDEYYNHKQSPDLADTVTVKAGQVTSGVNFSLKYGAVITGRVKAPAGKDLPASFYVYVYPDSETWTNHYQSFYFWSTLPSETTYVVGGLPAGRYRVAFKTYSSSSPYLDLYYPAARKYEEGTVISLADGEKRDSINFILQEGLTIKGRIRTADGGPLPRNLYLRLYPDTAEGWWDNSKSTSVWGPSTAMPSETTFIFGGSLPGRYTALLEVLDTASDYMSQFFRDAYTFTGATFFNKSEDDTATEVLFVLKKGASISGTVRTGDGGALPGFSINALRMDPGVDYKDDPITRTFSYNTTGTSLTQIQFKIRGLVPGNYKVAYSGGYGESSNYLPEYFSNSYDERGAATVALSALENRTGVDFTLEKGAEINGTISTADGGPLPWSFSVIVLDSTGNDIGDNGQNYFWFDTMAVPPSSVTYRIYAVPPGAAFVGVNLNSIEDTSGYMTEWYSNARTFAAAQPLPVTLGQKVTGIDITLDRGGTIRGRVLDSATGLPVRFAVLLAFGENEASMTSSFFLDQFHVGFSDSSGYYTILGLPDGNYKVQYLSFIEDDEFAAGYRTEFYSNTARMRDGNAILITGHSTRDSIDFNLKSTGFGSISGYLLSPAGDTLKHESQYGGDAVVYAFQDSQWYSIGTVNSRSGLYQITNLAPGAYKVAIATPSQNWSRGKAVEYDFHLNTKSYLAALDVNVIAGDTLENINIVTVPVASESAQEPESDATALESNIPNPFNPSTTIRFTVSRADLSRAVEARVRIYNPAGALVRSLDVKTDRPGRHQVVWNGMDGKGRSAASGLYLLRLEIAGKVMTRRIVLMK